MDWKYINAKLEKAGVPTEEIRAVREYLEAPTRYSTSRYVNDYGFTSPNIMVRGKRLSVFGLDSPLRITELYPEEAP